MNQGLTRIISASPNDRLGLFLGAAQRMGTAVENVEKDFWVCWLLDAFFNGLPATSPRRLFKGGTSLSKAFDLIDRFSEDVDVAIFREDLRQAASADDLQKLSGQQRKRRLEAILGACQVYINGQLLTELTTVVTDTMRAAGVAPSEYQLQANGGDPDRQGLLFHYPAVATGGGYVQAVVKLEAGARSALDPHLTATVRPYVAADVQEDLVVGNVITISPERTFWDKIVILHGLRQWFDRRGVLLHGNQRVSRHYYDVHTLMQAPDAEKWIADRELGQQCALHAQMFFHRPDLRQDLAVDGQYTIVPTAPMIKLLSGDYDRMAGMIFGARPALPDVLASITELEKRITS